MSTEVEPPEKKPKLPDSSVNIFEQTVDKYIESITVSEKNLQPIISEEFYEPVQLTKAYAGHIRDPKDISRTILTLNERIPLKGLSHLKRVSRQNVILCPTSVLQSMSSIQEYIEYHITELKDVFDYFKEVDVPSHAPKVVKQYTEARKVWSCNFHPNEYYEKLVGGNFFNIYEVKLHRKYMEVVFEVTKWYSIHKGVDFGDYNVFENGNATVVVDPISNRVIAIAHDYRQLHPMQHSAMLAIDNVAKTQDGGVWATESNNNIIPGVENELINHLKQKFSHLTFGLKNSKNKMKLDGRKDGVQDDLHNNINTESSQGKSGHETDLCDEESNLKTDNQMNSEGKAGPYLCTGYHVYTLREPCVMCSMALVHARAKRVFFCFNNRAYGGLCSVAKLQTVPSLNHHFEVFTGFL